MTFLKNVIRFVSIFLILMLTFSLLLVVSYTLPVEPMQKNLAQDIDLLGKEGIYPQPFLGSSLTQGDNFTEVLFLNMATYNGNSTVLEKAFSAPYLFNWEDPIDTLKQIHDPSYSNPEVELFESQIPKYWNGGQIILKPLLFLFSYRQIRTISFAVFLLTFVVCLLSIRRKLGLIYSLTFGISLVTVWFFTVPSTVSMVLPWIVTFITCIIILQKRTFKIIDCTLLFFISGCVTNYFDYMLTVLYSVGIPLIILLSLTYHNKTCSMLKQIVLMSSTGFSYFIGFSLSWITKWSLSSLVLGRNVFDEALFSVNDRLSLLEGTSRFTSLQANWNLLTQSNLLIFFNLTILFLFIAVIFFHQKGLRTWLLALTILPLTALPYLWYTVLANHSLIHAPFVYRYQVIALIALCFTLCNLINQAQFKAFLSKPKPMQKASLQNVYKSTSQN